MLSRYPPTNPSSLPPTNTEPPPLPKVPPLRALLSPSPIHLTPPTLLFLFLLSSPHPFVRILEARLPTHTPTHIHCRGKKKSGGVWQIKQNKTAQKAYSRLCVAFIGGGIRVCV